MKTLKKLLPVFALILGFALVFTQSAFKSPSVNLVQYQYTGPNEAGLTNETNWKVVDDNHPSSCELGSEIPCVIEFNTNTYADLGTFLIAKPTTSDMVSAGAVISKRNEK